MLIDADAEAQIRLARLPFVRAYFQNFSGNFFGPLAHLVFVTVHGNGDGILEKQDGSNTPQASCQKVH